MQHNGHIYLIGFMGSGKSYTGSRLAALMQRDFIDLDDFLEQEAGQTITEIFDEYGEAHFRQLEAAALVAVSKQPPAVIACGGGTPCQPSNLQQMEKTGTTVFLDVAEAVLLERLTAGIAHRPLLFAQSDLRNFIKKTLVKRRPIYEKVDIQLRLDNPNEDVARLLLDHLHPN